MGRAHEGGRRARRVDFAIDGHVVWSDSRKPFAFAGGRGWNTTGMANGTHVLTVRASGAGRARLQRLVVHVANRDFALTTSSAACVAESQGHCADPCERARRQDERDRALRGSSPSETSQYRGPHDGQATG